MFAKDYDNTEYMIWEWRRNMDDLKQIENFHGSMVQAIARMLFNCPYDMMDHIRADPNLWVKNQNSPDGMTSIISQIQDEIRFLNSERTAKGLPAKRFSFLEGAQSDISCIEVIQSFWQDPKNPQYKLFKSCTGAITEYEELLWEDWSESQQDKRNIREKIMDKNNHSWDAAKYYLLSRHTRPTEKKQVAGRGSMGWFLERVKQSERQNLKMRRM